MNNILYFVPLIVIIVCQSVYQICAKSVPDGMDPFAAVFFNYVIAMTMSLILWLAFGTDHSVTTQISKMNWAPVVMAMTITGIEIATIFLFRFGWNVSTASTISYVVTAIILVVVGVMFYKEVITAKTLVGIGFCLVGLWMVSK